MEEYVLKKMSEIIGVSGHEKTIRRQIENFIANSGAHVHTYTDRIGNLICYKKGMQSNCKVMIVAHMDEVGFQIMKFHGDYAYLKVLGNIKTWNMLNQHISDASGAKSGIIYCDDPEDIKPYEYEKIKAIPTKGDFEIGDVFSFTGQFVDAENLWIGKAMDNRISCYILYELIRAEIANIDDIYYVFTTQEESGMRGVRVAITSLNPDIIIDVDVSPVGERNSLEMGKGVGIKLSDSIGISSENLVEQVKQYALNNNIEHQQEVSDCGTSELIITNERDAGAERIGLSIPCKNMHSPMTMIYKNDAWACLHLLEVILKNGLKLTPDYF